MHLTIDLPREVAGVRIPDSDIARKAAELVFRASTPVVRNHVVRTFVFGSLIGSKQGLKWDEELLFLGAVLHDLGLTTEYRSAERFEVGGADAADEFLKAEGVTAERREIVWDAIALHTSMGIASRKRPEIALVHIGAGVDVVGKALDALPPALVAETIEALPRHDFKNAFYSTVVETVVQAPQSATMTWMSDIVNAHAPGCPCPSLASVIRNSAFEE